ncbi:MAG: hypothetical protein LBU32_32775 [Clostridiales bacterium]|nr:hypothetical protein [Clostridiales bacterium]
MEIAAGLAAGTASQVHGCPPRRNMSSEARAAQCGNPHSIIQCGAGEFRLFENC